VNSLSFFTEEGKSVSCKFIFVTGGVTSSLGKGLASASIGCLLEHYGLKIAFLKLDPYINVDPGTMSPFQHGEVFVTEDGTETDLDLGHYERFTKFTAKKTNNITSGAIYYSVISKERHGDYLGSTVQVIPHITNEIKNSILKISHDVDIVICEVGGTVGDIESLPFLEAIRQFKKDRGAENVVYIHLTLVPYIAAAQELKTKPTQHSVKELREIGIQPDILLCRTDRYLPEEVKFKIALFCNVDKRAVITAKDVDIIYEVPLIYHKEELDKLLLELLHLKVSNIDLSAWKHLVDLLRQPLQTVNIGVIGKYIHLKDAYKSLAEALIHGGLKNRIKVNISWVEAEEITEYNILSIQRFDGILVPGGFGDRGIEEKIRVIKFARENNIPFFGICLGMQCAIIEFARNVLHMENANSTEFDPDTPFPVIDLIPEQRQIKNLGGTMRLGNYPCELLPNTRVFQIYGGVNEIQERHRHRYELNIWDFPSLIFEKRGLILSGKSPDNKFTKIIELKDHRWFVACQFHPEFKSRLYDPHPLFTSFIEAAFQYKKEIAENYFE
jgi:CTP synthase